MLNITKVEKSPDVVLGVVDPVSIPEEYSNLAEVFSKKAANALPAYKNQDPLLETCGTLFFNSLHNLSPTKLEMLCDYIFDNLAKRFLQSSIFSAGALIIFVKKKKKALYGYL